MEIKKWEIALIFFIWHILSILTLFRYGRVEKIKLLPKISPDGGRAAFVDFVDIRSATKANEAQNSIGGRDLRTNYNEPGHKHHQNHDMHRMHGGFPPGWVFVSLQYEIMEIG